MPANSHPSSHKFRAPRTIFWVALGLRIACIAIGHTYLIRANDGFFDFGFEAGRIARSLVQGHGYSNPFNGVSGPTAWLPPIYPLLIALAFKLFGIYTRAAAFFILICNSIFSAATVPAVYEIAARCFDAQGIVRRRSKSAQPVALWSAWIWAIHPAALQYAIHWIWEMSLTTCLFTWALVLTLRLRRIGEHDDADENGQSSNVRLWSLLGLLWGLIALSNASLLLAFPASMLWVWWPALHQANKRRSLPGLLRGTVVAFVIFALVLTPWIIRNERALHAFVPVRSNFGIELWQSTHFYYGIFPWGTAMPLWPGDPDFQRYARIGEIAYAHEKGEEAMRNLRKYPERFLQNTGQRVLFFWLGVPHPSERHTTNEVIRTFNFDFLSLSGFLGLALALQRRVPGATLFALAFALVPVAYYIVTVQARFRHPLEPLIAILSVYLFRSTTPTTKNAA